MCMCVCVCREKENVYRGREDNNDYQIQPGFHFGGGRHYGFYGNHKHSSCQVSTIVTLLKCIRES